MNQYHKIKTLYKRDPKNMRYLLEGEWALPEFEYLANNQWVWTEKVDGTNIRVMWDGKAVTFGGKTDNAQMYVPLMQRLQELFDTTPKRKIFKDKFGEEGGVCLYGEGYGKKIQKVGSKYNPDENDFVLFDVKVGEWWLQREDVEDVAVALGIKVVPIVGEGNLYEAAEYVKTRPQSQWGDFTSEGIIARPKTEILDRGGKRIITKIKVRDFREE